MEPDTSTPATNRARTGAIGTRIAAYAFFDVIPIAASVIALTAWFECRLVLFSAVAVALAVLDIVSPVSLSPHGCRTLN